LHRIARKFYSLSPICYFSSPFFLLSSDETKHSQVVFSFVDFIVLLDDFVVAIKAIAVVPAVLGSPPCCFGSDSTAMLCSDEDRRGFDEFLRLRVEDV
jgi:hypothetical protein